MGNVVVMSSLIPEPPQYSDSPHHLKSELSINITCIIDMSFSPFNKSVLLDLLDATLDVRGQKIVLVVEYTR